MAILLNLWPDKSRVGSWGRAFGSLCISYDQDSQGKRRGIVSFAAMLRSHGDEFAGRTASAKKNLLRSPGQYFCTKLRVSLRRFRFQSDRG